MAIVDELITSLGVSINHDVSTNITRFKNLLTGLTKNVTRLSIALGAAGATAGYFIQRTSAQAQEMENLSKQTGVSTDSLQSWAYAATKAGVSAQTVQGDIIRLQRKWGMFGIDANKQMERLANLFSRMSPKRAVFYGGFFGISPDTVLLLQRGKDALEQFKKEAEESGAIISKENIERAAQFNRTLLTLKYVLNSLLRQIAIAAMPALEKLANKFQNLVKENRRWLTLKTAETMTGVSLALERVTNLYDRLKTKIKPVTDALKDFNPQMKWSEGVMRLVSAALILLIPKLIAMSAPILGTALAITVLALAIDDLITHLEKGDSLIGPFWDKLNKLGENMGDWLWENARIGEAPTKEGMKRVIPGYEKLTGMADSFKAWLHRNDPKTGGSKFNDGNRLPGSIGGSFGLPASTGAVQVQGFDYASGKLNPSGPYTDNRQYNFNFGPLPEKLTLPQLSLQLQRILEDTARMNAPQRAR